MPMKADWPSPARVRLRQTSVPRLPLREITPTRPGLNTLGTKAGMMPTKHSPGVTRPAVLGPTMRVPCLRGCGMHRHHVLRRDVLGQHHQQLDAGLRRRHGRLLCHGRRDEHDGDIGADLLRGVRRGGEDRHADMGFARALGIDAADHMGAVGDHLLGPERALLAGDAEHDHAVFFAHDHDAAFTAAWMASSMKS